jgi:hypothetical protein
MINLQQVRIFLIIILMSAPVGAFGEELRSFIEIREKGIINWTDGVVEARGIGYPGFYTSNGKSQAERQEVFFEALSKAQHNLLETVVGLRIDSHKRVIDIVENYPPIMTQLKDMVRKAPEVEELRKLHYDGTVEVWSQMSLNGGFSQLVLPPEITHIEPIKQVLPHHNPLKSKIRSRSSEIFTGMVVDARGLQVIPVLAPRILDENLEEVFGPTYVSREFAVQNGITHYTNDMLGAKFDLRVSDNPLIAKALKTLWPGRCDFVISNADADKLRSASEHLAFLKACRVIIVIDQVQQSRE